MSDFTFVAPFHPPLFPRLAGKRVVLVVDRADLVCQVPQVVGDHKLDLACVYLRQQNREFALEIDAGWGGLRLALEMPPPLRFSALFPYLETLAQLNVRLYIDGAAPGALPTTRILASLGYSCCVVLSREKAPQLDWDALKDLAVYALYPPQPHGEIDPFAYVARRGDEHGFVDPRGVYFDDPSQYVHVDEEGRLSLCAADQRARVFLDEPIEEQAQVRESAAYQDAMDAWKGVFVEPNPCARCEGWRVCQGLFAPTDGQPRCQDVFREVLEGAEHTLERQKAVKQTWRP